VPGVEQILDRRQFLDQARDVEILVDVVGDFGGRLLALGIGFGQAAGEFLGGDRLRLQRKTAAAADFRKCGERQRCIGAPENRQKIGVDRTEHDTVLAGESVGQAGHCRHCCAQFAVGRAGSSGTPASPQLGICFSP